MSHEIRTPLNAIKGFSGLLSQTQLNNEQQQYSSILNDESGNLMNIVNDILDISRIEAGKLRIEIKEFNLKKVMQSVENMFFNTAVGKGLQYFQQMGDAVPVNLKGDPDRLSQVLINLISSDKETMPDSLAGLAASAAIAVSDIPFNGPISEVRVARIDGKFVINPTRTQLATADMEILVAASEHDVIY